jgi:hypothetical protein
MTPGKVLVMPRNSTAKSPRACACSDMVPLEVIA